MKPQSKHINDLWSAYRYGDKIKIVYHKCGKINNLQKQIDLSGFTPTEAEIEGRFEQSISRTRSTIFELALCNPFEWFVTLTLDKDKKNRVDLKGFSKSFAQFIRDQNKKRNVNEKIEYLLIPEQHQDGAWHMHGLFKGLGKKDLVKNEYGYLDWLEYRKRFGFFSCSKIKSHEACSKYITKYVTKDIKKATALQSGAHSYYASQGLQRREPLFVLCGDRCPFAVNGDKWDFENDYVKILWLKGAEKNELTFLVK